MENSQLEESVMINEVAFAIPLVPYAGLAINLALSAAFSYLTVNSVNDLFVGGNLAENAKLLSNLPAAEQTKAIDASTQYLTPKQGRFSLRNLGFNAAIILVLKQIWDVIVQFVSQYWWIIIIALLGAAMFTPQGRRLIKNLARNANKKFKKHKKEDLKKAQRGEEI